MSTAEIRLDQLTGLRTILAPARSDRPLELEITERGGEVEDCPFCEGQEERTPREIWADRPGNGGPDTPGWRVRSVPNLYPALAEPLERGGGAAGPSGAGGGSAVPADPLGVSARAGEPDLFSAQPARGAHEVIVHTPEHLVAMAGLDDEAFAAAVAGWRSRMRARAETAYVQLIVNEGAEAGASREHTHAQLYALSFVPVQVARERERFSAYHQRTQGGDLLADIAAEEVRRRERLVGIDDEAMLICPWASHSPFEMRLLPRRPSPRFEEDGEIGTAMLARALRALAARFGAPPPLNLWVRTAPRGIDQFGWRVDIAPRIAIRAGFELSTGVDICVVAPERAAAEMRDCLPS